MPEHEWREPTPEPDSGSGSSGNPWKLPSQDSEDDLLQLPEGEVTEVDGTSSGKLTPEDSADSGRRRNRDYRVEQQAREPVVLPLIKLGLTLQEIAQAVGCSFASIAKDSIRLHASGQLSPSPEAPTPGQAFRAQLQTYAILWKQLGLDDEHSFGPKQRGPSRIRLERPDEVIFLALEAKLGVKGWVAELDTLGKAFEYQQTLRVESFSQERIIQLLHDTLGQPRIDPVSRGSQVVRDYLEQVSASDQETSLEALIPDTETALLERWKKEIMREAGGPESFRQALTANDVTSILGILQHALSPRELMVLRRRFGLDGQAPATLEAIGETMGVCKERVRQIEAKALRKLRHPARTIARFAETIGQRCKRLEREASQRLSVVVSSRDLDTPLPESPTDSTVVQRDPIEDTENEGPPLAEGMRAFYEARITELRKRVADLSEELEQTIRDHRSDRERH